MSIPSESTSKSPVVDDPALPIESPELRAGWWMQVAQVRFRFFLIVAISGLIVSQWPLLRGVWERWSWGFGHKHAEGTVSTSQEYFCPMDPGVISVWPAICPICNMDLVPRKKMEAVILPEGVVARMQLSPYRVQLAGIRTTKVEERRLDFERSFKGVVRHLDENLLGLETSLSVEEASRFSPQATATIVLASQSEPLAATVRMNEGDRLARLQVLLTDAPSELFGQTAEATIRVPANDGAEVLVVPESAVVDRGRERLVYVETMPGMFDGVSVELGPRYGSYYPVRKGLKSGQRVASAGAFLIDAETRLNPSLAAGYFGANQSESGSVPPSSKGATASPLARKSAAPKKTLSADDQAIVDRQKICPVTELPLASMGGPVPVMVAGRKVFICCGGCEQRLKDEPEKYLARISTP